MQEQQEQQQPQIIPMNKPRIKVFTGSIEEVEESYMAWMEELAIHVTIVNPKIDDVDITRMTLVIFYLIANV